MSLRMLKRTHSMLDLTSTNHGAQPPYKVARMASFVDAPSMRTAVLARTPTPVPAPDENMPPSTPPPAAAATKHTTKSPSRAVLTPPKRPAACETECDGDTEPEDNMEVDVEVSRDSDTELDTDSESDSESEGGSETASETDEDEWSSEDDEFIDDDDDDNKPESVPIAAAIPTRPPLTNTSPPALLRAASLPNLPATTATATATTDSTDLSALAASTFARIPVQPARPLASTSRALLSPIASPLVTGRTLAQVDKGLKLRLAFARSASPATTSNKHHQLHPTSLAGAKLARRPFVPIVWPDRGAMVFEPRFVPRTRSLLVPAGEPNARHRRAASPTKKPRKAKRDAMDVDSSPQSKPPRQQQRRSSKRARRTTQGHGRGHGQSYYTLSSPVPTPYHNLRVLPPTCTEQLRRQDSDELRRVALMSCFGPRKTVKFWDLRSRRISVQ